MPLAQRVFDAVMARRGRGVLARGAFQAALWGWKALRFVPGVNRWQVTLPVGGLHVRVRAFSYDDLLTASRGYEPLVARLAPGQGATAIDAGAFIGRHTLDLARAVGPTGRVVAVEPHPGNFKLLTTNVQRNDLGWVACVPCALGRAYGWARLRVGRETSTAAIGASAKASPVERDAVCVRTLDGVLAELGIDRVDFVKIDVEGVELDVLVGAERTLQASPSVRLLIEIHGPARDPEAGAAVRRWLSARDYTVEEEWDGPRRFFVAVRAAGRPAVECQNSVAARDRSDILAGS